MGDIYRSASNFYAWLGEDSGTAALTSFFPSQDILGTALVGAVISKAARIFFKPENDSTKPKDTPNDEYANKLTIPERHAWFVFIDLCRRPYWTRTWIVQELLLAQSVIVCIGSTRFMWKQFAAFMDCCAIQWREGIGWSVPKEIHLIQNLIEMMELSVKCRYNSLDELLQQYNKQSCLDVRDRIYALLSLADNGHDIVPDYTLNRLDLFFQLKDLVKNHRCLRTSLDLSNEEIKYRAETLDFETYHDKGSVFVGFESAQSVLQARQARYEWRMGTASSKSLPGRRAWATLPWCYSYRIYSHWAKVSASRWSQKIKKPQDGATIHEDGSRYIWFEQREIVQVTTNSVRDGRMWYARKRNGEIGTIDKQYLELLDIG